jgi:hypothetical protein
VCYDGVVDLADVMGMIETICAMLVVRAGVMEEKMRDGRLYDGGICT